jgi:hypothetical protein
VNCTPCARAPVLSTCVAAAAQRGFSWHRWAAEINSAARPPARVRWAGGCAATRTAKGWASRGRFASEGGLARRCVRDPPAQRHNATCHKMQNPRPGVVGPHARECEGLFETRFLSQQRSSDRLYPLERALLLRAFAQQVDVHKVWIGTLRCCSRSTGPWRPFRGAFPKLDRRSRQPERRTEE